MKFVRRSQVSCTCLVLCIFAFCCENESVWELDEKKVIKYEGKQQKKLLVSTITRERKTIFEFEFLLSLKDVITISCYNHVCVFVCTTIHNSQSRKKVGAEFYGSPKALFLFCIKKTDIIAFGVQMAILHYYKNYIQRRFIQWRFKKTSTFNKTFIISWRLVESGLTMVFFGGIIGAFVQASLNNLLFFFFLVLF